MLLGVNFLPLGMAGACGAVVAHVGECLARVGGTHLACAIVPTHSVHARRTRHVKREHRSAPMTRHVVITLAPVTQAHRWRS